MAKLDSLTPRVRGILANVLGEEATLELEPTWSGIKIGGVLVAQRFEDLDQRDRQRLVWEALRRALSPEEQLLLAPMITLTPDEFARMQPSA